MKIISTTYLFLITKNFYFAIKKKTKLNNNYLKTKFSIVFLICNCFRIFVISNEINRFEMFENTKYIYIYNLLIKLFSFSKYLNPNLLFTSLSKLLLLFKHSKKMLHFLFLSLIFKRKVYNFAYSNNSILICRNVKSQLFLSI